VTFLCFILRFNSEEIEAVTRRAIENNTASRLWIIMMSQPTKPNSIINNKAPKANLKKAGSFSKKTCARNVPLIKK